MGILKLVLKVFSKFFLDAFHKSPKIITIFAKKGLEFFPKYIDILIFFYCMMAFILFLASADIVSNKKSRKRIQLSILAFVMSK